MGRPEFTVTRYKVFSKKIDSSNPKSLIGSLINNEERTKRSMVFLFVFFFSFLEKQTQSQGK